MDGQVSSPCGGLRKRDLTKCTMLSTAKTYSVTVCFALDPGHFYVHFTEQKARLEELQEAIEKFYSDVSLPKVPIISGGKIVTLIDRSGTF